MAFEFPETVDPGVGDMAVHRNRDAACAQQSVEGTLVKKPIDLIIVIDNSGSMSDEIRGVEANINKNLADILKNSGIDYRVIMVTSHGLSQQYKICVGPPLSKNVCPPNGPPMNNPPRYYHYDYNIQSTDSFQKLLNTYALADVHGLAPKGWSGYLRKDAVKMFLEITDDRSSMDEVMFDTQLLAKDKLQFGDAKARKYIWHSIIGIVANVPATKPWFPKDPFQMAKCGIGAVNEGPQYQRLSILTGGLRFPICEWANFDGVFKELAKGIVEGTKVACQLEMPTPPMGEEIDLETLVVEYQPSIQGAEKIDFHFVWGPQDCGPETFYLIDNTIHLCPDACTTVQRDPMAKVRVLYDCKQQLM